MTKRDVMMVARTEDLKKAAPHVDPFELGAIEKKCSICRKPVLVALETQRLLPLTLVCSKCWVDDGRPIVVTYGPTTEAILKERGL